MSSPGTQPVAVAIAAGNDSIDVPLDWLYKGKRRPNSNVVVPVLPQQGVQRVPVQQEQAHGAEPHGRRSRSSSVSNGVLDSAGLKVQNKQLKQPSSTSSSSHRPRSSSMSTEKPKKSLFESLFGKKSVQQPTRPVSIPSSATPPTTAPGDTANRSPTMSVSPPKSLQRQAESAPPQGETVAEDPLDGVRLRRVVFAVDKFRGDPPQQLPSRKPKLGNVLIPEDMVSEQPLISQGITSNSGGGESSSDQPSLQLGKFSRDSKEYRQALEAYRKDLKETEVHQQEARKAAERVAKEVRGYKPVQGRDQAGAGGGVSRKGIPLLETVKDSFPHQAEAEVPENYEKLKNVHIDNPLHVHENYFGTARADHTAQEELTLDTVYTRCCHLREILPIPSTLRQVRGKTAPLPTLKFLNPRPTLIDILSFCDFIAVVPIHTVIFDNVSLTLEMLRIILSSLVRSQVLEKLGLRNVVINQTGWKYLCQFLMQNTSLSKLDISQTKTRSDLPLWDYRECMDWGVFCHVLRNRKSKPLEELLLNGVKILHIPLPQFQSLLNVFGFKYNNEIQKLLGFHHNPNVGVRLGIACSEVNEDYLCAIFEWMSQYNVQGVDLAFNHLNPFIRVMAKKLAKLSFTNLNYFTVNSCNLADVPNTVVLLKYLSRVATLKFLDLSNNPALFPSIIPYLYKYLPRFPNLCRIHLDNNNLSYRQATMICNILVKCPVLAHVSLLSQSVPETAPTTAAGSSPGTATPMDANLADLTKGSGTEGQKVFTKNAVWAALYSLAKGRPSLVSLDINYEEVPDEIKSRIALCLMRNMQRTVDKDFHLDELSSQDELLFDGALAAETADEVLKKLNSNNGWNEDVDPNTVAAKKYLLKKYLERIETLLQNVAGDDRQRVREAEDRGPAHEGEGELGPLAAFGEKLEEHPRDHAAYPTGSRTDPCRFRERVTLTRWQRQWATGHRGPAGQAAALVEALGLRTTHGCGCSTGGRKRPTKPHIMAAEKDRVVDIDTGKALLIRTPSTTSLASKIQEKEEGELHKWGIFMQHQGTMYPLDNITTARDRANPSATVDSPLQFQFAPQEITSERAHHDKSQEVDGDPSTHTEDPASSVPKILPRIPSGEDLRKAIINAKGVDSIDDLIQNVTHNHQELEKIYNAAYFLSGKKVGNEILNKSLLEAESKPPTH
ncbi:Her1p KNAG_0A03090 [Huiozyma naganishii CBS 8797]|uniref:Uncharacterized protein n=1 Tax=Huiozyma naganishii (strain ATCC MYA-139 / BCRC 22969 / CBS 8797 / KCTC 17520 / NBRC 10181 / NCYC 3082 / Yp74L-3) TaxID=1071383 RepID=J7RTF9_HUIN7|nr:hypothetical protein KNAG_0A03090 [Kazachstania naganishii CBS 8797]CCK67997.1 hypothetical protein KNAG_0A03090 [Kazachstania naganishii CBS 8797]